MKYKYQSRNLDGIIVPMVQVENQDYSLDSLERFKQKYGRDTILCTKEPSGLWGSMGRHQSLIPATAFLDALPWENRDF